ncbi:hypothetical protein [Streptomyces sp. HC307]|uniref:hypothetical protein n=1 Tax=Streptomyces flavusporus TaxID=3385496 RepID=UPI0039174E54
MIDYQVDGGETIRLLTDLLDPGAWHEELAALYHERWEVESAHRQLKQRGKAEVLRSVLSPELVRQETGPA